MDSMVGYKNEKYIDFGRYAARLDDLANYIPSRIAALLMIAGSGVCRLNPGNALRIYRRDRRKHASPNSAQTESVCAGALGIRLAGDAWYFGQKVEKPYIGDNLRRIEAEDIRRANVLLYVTSFLMWGICLVVCAVLRKAWLSPW
jgi:adenosylcobinamide-phosphate synthase